MRVVSGTAKGKTLLGVPGDTTRPILDRVKTALFDIIRPIVPGSSWLDMFAGSGGVGIEALSQGAAHCTFTEIAPAAVQVIRKNLELTKLADRGEVRQIDTLLFLRKTERKFDFLFVAPPQYKGIWVEALHAIAERPEVVAEGGRIIVQIDPKEYEPVTMKDFIEEESRVYGNSQILLYCRS